MDIACFFLLIELRDEFIATTDGAGANPTMRSWQAGKL
jgi:hypothetical protein